MANRFPHMSDTGFPDVQNVDAYKYRNEFDYSKYNRAQMRITICSVPWDVGLIHVGNAQIGGLGNVVYFDSPDARDEYLNSIENKFTWETKYRAYHDDGYIEVPLPYEKCVLFNYCYIEYDPLPVDWGTGGKNKFFFFIRSCEYLAPNTSKIEILRDTWQTYIYDVNITNMMLERGHAPMSITDADRYLANPIENTGYLLAEDVNYGGAMRPKYASNIVLNSENMQAVIVTSGNLSDAWGAKGSGAWVTPGDTKMLDGVSSYHAYAIDAENLSGFLTYVKNNLPQFPQTVQGVFFVSGEFLDFVGQAIRIGQYSLFEVEQQTKELDLLELTKSQFGYGAKYEDLAKLYTYPYAYLEVSDENGNKQQLRIEETSGNLSLTVTTNIAYPFMKINAHMGGIGEGAGAVTFANADSHTFNFDGRWYDYLYEWDIPSFAVIQSNSDYYDFSTYYDREQRAFEIDAAYRNALDSADVSKTNADASSNTAKTNADASANTSKRTGDASALAAYSNANDNANTARLNATAKADTSKANADANANTDYETAVRSATAAKQNANDNALTAKTNADAASNTAKANAIASADTSLENSLASNATAKTNADASADVSNANSIRSYTAAYDNSLASNAATETIAKRVNQTSSNITYADSQARFDVADVRSYVTAQNAYNSNGTAASNAKASATTSEGNSYISNARTQSNTIDASETSYYNTENLNNATSLNAADTRGTNTIIRNDADGVANSKTALGNQKVQSDTYSDIALAASMAAIDADLAMATTALNTVSDAVGGVLAGAQNGALSGAAAGVPGAAIGALAGAGASAIGQMASASVANAAIAITMTNNQNVLDAQSFNAIAKLGYAQSAASNITAVENAFQDRQVQNQNTLNEVTTTRSVNASNAAALATHNATVSNANATKSDADTIASNTRATAHANADRTKAANDGNAERSYLSETSGEIYAPTGRYGTNWIEFWNARNKADIQKTASDLNAEDSKTTADANALRKRNADRDNTQASLTLAKNTVNPNIKNTADANANRSKDTATDNANRSNATDLANHTRTYNTAIGVAARNETAALANAQAKKNTSLGNNLFDWQTETGNIDRTYSNASTVNRRAYDTALNNNVANLQTSLANNARTLETSLANNERSFDLAYSVAERNREVGLEGIENDIRQAALEAPKVFGTVSDAETATSRPQGLFCNIITQSKDAIEQAGDYFLRFGYAVNRAWEFETFNLMPHFTYWKASDMWISGNNVPDKYLDEIRFYLLGGVCVWRNPADIGNIAIYENR